MDATKIEEAKARDAAAAEADTDGEDEAADDDAQTEREPEHDAGGETQPEGAKPLSEKEFKRRLDQLERETERHGKRVAEIMGDDFAMVEVCPLDFTPGYVMPAMAETLPDDVKDRVRALIGDGGAPKLREAEGVEMCPRCDGFGQLAFPTRNPHVQTQMCPECSGQGYVNVAPPTPPAAPAPAFQPWQPATATATNGPGVLDSWGRPVGHPHYGQNPASVGA